MEVYPDGVIVPMISKGLGSYGTWPKTKVRDDKANSEENNMIEVYWRWITNRRLLKYNDSKNQK